MARANFFIALGIVFVGMLIILNVWTVLLYKHEERKVEKEAAKEWLAKNRIDNSDDEEIW